MQHLRGSKTFMTKTELIDTAEASGLSAKPMKGGGVTSYHGGPPTGMLLHVVLYQLMPTHKTDSKACCLDLTFVCPCTEPTHLGCLLPADKGHHSSSHCMNTQWHDMKGTFLDLHQTAK